jgi:hypothetical protein
VEGNVSASPQGGDNVSNKNETENVVKFERFKRLGAHRLVADAKRGRFGMGGRHSVVLCGGPREGVAMRFGAMLRWACHRRLSTAPFATYLAAGRGV